MRDDIFETFPPLQSEDIILVGIVGAVYIHIAIHIDTQYIYINMLYIYGGKFF